MEEADDAICAQLFIQRIRYLNPEYGNSVDFYLY